MAEISDRDMNIARHVHAFGRIDWIAQAIADAREEACRDMNERLRDALTKARRVMIVCVTGVSDGLTIHDVRRWIAEADSALGDTIEGKWQPKGLLPTQDDPRKDGLQSK